MKWGGEVAGQRTEGKPKPLVGLYVEAPLLTEVTEGLQELQLDITISAVELKILEDLQSLLRKPDVETRDVDKLLHSYLGVLLFIIITINYYNLIIPFSLSGLSLPLLHLPLHSDHVRERPGLQARQGQGSHLEPSQLIPLVYQTKKNKGE